MKILFVLTLMVTFGHSAPSLAQTESAATAQTVGELQKEQEAKAAPAAECTFKLEGDAFSPDKNPTYSKALDEHARSALGELGCTEAKSDEAAKYTLGFGLTVASNGLGVATLFQGGGMSEQKQQSFTMKMKDSKKVYATIQSFLDALLAKVKSREVAELARELKN